MGGTGSPGNFGFYYGVLFQGDTYLKSATIADATSSDYVIHALGAPHVHQAVLRDDTNSLRSIDIRGSHSIGIDLTEGTYGIGIALPQTAGIGFRGLNQVMLYNAVTAKLQYGLDGTSALWTVDNSGNMALTGGILAASLNVSNYSAGGVAGVSCSGPPTANFQVTAGIVTRC